MLILSALALAAADAGASSCGDDMAVDLTNRLEETLRPMWIPDEAGAQDAPMLRPLPPRQQQRLRVPAGSGWLVAERLLWRGVLNPASATYVVRAPANRSSGTAALPTRRPGPHGATRANASFALLINAERVPLHLCTQPPAEADVPPPNEHCHGVVSPLEQRYLLGVPVGSSLFAYEVVWGARLTPNGGGAASGAVDDGAVASHRIDRHVAHGAAPYMSVYKSHAERLRAEGDSHVEGRAEGGGAEARAALVNHLANPALVCRVGGAGTANAQAYHCVANVPPRGVSELRLASLRATGEGGAASAGGASASDASPWNVLELVGRQAVEERASVITFGPERRAPSAPSPSPAHRGKWVIRNRYDFPISVCEATAGEMPTSGGEMPISRGEMPISAMVCIPKHLEPRGALIAPPLPDTRAVPVPRALIAIRLCHRLSPPTPSPGVHTVTVGLGALRTHLHAGETGPLERATASAASAAAALSGGDAHANTDDVHVARGDVERAATWLEAPPSPSGTAAWCEARWSHADLPAVISSVIRQWDVITVALGGGEVPLEVPADMVELGTEADPTRKLIITRAAHELPHTHPYSILQPRCADAPAAQGGREACTSRLATWLNLSLSHRDVALNASATFRSDPASRRRLFASPFVFNIECSALLCAYTRVLTHEPPYAATQRALKKAAGHVSPFNARAQLEEMFETLARR